MEKEKFLIVFWGGVSFCVVSSLVYVINDIMDKEKDKLHPKKKFRPIASGEISIKHAVWFAIALLAIAVMINILVLGENYSAWLVCGGYLATNILYSVAGLKKIPLLDIVLLVLGFFLRVLFGACIIGVSISQWLYLVIITGACYLGFGKRRNELRVSDGKTREVLVKYSAHYLDKNLNCCMTLAIVFYSLWCVEKSTYGSINLMLTVPILMLIFFKYGLELDGNSDGDPVDVILHDKWLVSLILVFGILILCSLYQMKLEKRKEIV